MKRILFFVMLFTAVLSAESQTEQIYELKISDHGYLTGFSKTVSGLDFNYHSMSPDITSALLVRANSGKMAVEWETEPVRFAPGQEVVKFMWVAGIGCNMGINHFDFFINDELTCTMLSVDKEKWEINSEKDIRLAFESVFIDNVGDRFGLMTLAIPKERFTEGESLRLKIRGRQENSSTWMMTFKETLKEKITIAPTHGLLRNNRQSISMSLTQFGKPATAEILIEGLDAQRIKLDKMFNQFTVSVPAADVSQTVNMQIKIEDKEILNQPLEIQPVNKFTLHLVQHSHTDIGYTRPQTDILSEHLRYIDYALDYCDQTDDFPEESKFRWTCEAAWPVREYLQNRPQQQIDRLRKRVQEGRIEITGMMFNMSDIADEASYVDFVKVIKDFKDQGLPVKTAMQNDVNGFAWALVDYFQNTGVEYVSMGTHGHKALIAFDHPTPFWLESPSGSRLLAFRADHYMTGNSFGVHGDNFNSFEKGVFKYLENLFESGYAYDEITVQYSGYLTDNSPPGLGGCENIRKWNKKYEWPKLRSAIAQNFLDNMKEKHAGELPVYRAAWPDWWTDGFGSAARETAASRETHAEMIANLGLLSIAKLSGAELPDTMEEKITAVQDALLFYDEHTYGAAESIRDRSCINSQVQWMEKAAYVWDAVKKSRLVTEYGMGLMQPYFSKTNHPVIVVFNSLNWKRSGLVEIFIDNEILPRDNDFKIVDDAGHELKAQRVSGRAEGNHWAIWVDHIPALGYKSFRIIKENTTRDLLPENSASTSGLDNEFYTLQIDPEKGAVSSFYDKELKKELCDNSGEWKLGQLIYELAGPRGQLDGFTYDNFSRQAWQDITVHNGVDGPVWSSLFIKARSDGFDDAFPIKMEIRLFHQAKRVEFHYTTRKEEITDPESVFIAFPFLMEDGIMKYEVHGGLVEPGKNQIPGSGSDWSTFQNFITIQGDEAQVVWGSDAMPLVHLGDINFGKFMVHASYDKPHIYSWPMNNLWVTNFCAAQSGEMHWSYYITSQSEVSESAAARFGWGSRVPFLCRVLPEGHQKEALSSASFLNMDAENLLLISSRPSDDGSGIILQLRETDGKAAVLKTDQLMRSVKVKAVKQVNVLGEALKSFKEEIRFKPFEVMFVKVEI